jgi:hypothetical protein
VGTTATACDPGQPHCLGGSVRLGNSSFEPSAASGFHLEATGGPPLEFGFFLYASSAGSSLSVFNGLLCLDAPLGRYSSTVAGNQGLPQRSSIGRFDAAGVPQNFAGTSGVGSGFDVPLELPYSPVGQFVASGSTFAVQLWCRDQLGSPPMPGSTANFSNALIVTFP